MEFFGSIPFLALKFLGFICLGAEKTAKGRRPSPRHPWAGCLTGIFSYVVPFEKFSWCFRSEDFRMNDIAICKNGRILLFYMEKMSCHFSILLVYWS